VSQPQPERDEFEVEAWRDLQAVLAERDREWWAETDREPADVE
jgi:hypothetical protein